MYKFVRIIDGAEYEEYLDFKIYKYIPRNLIYTFQKWVKPRIICNYKSSSNKSIVGYGVGIFLKESDISKDEYKKRLIDTINSLKEQEEYKDIYYFLNENLKLDYDDLKEIEDKCNVKIPSGKSIFAKNTLSCLKDTCKLKKEEISQKEVFIIGDDTKITEQLVEELATFTKFIEVFTEDLEFGKRLESDMFNKYGLSLHATQSIDKIYNDFDFIINLNEQSVFNISKLSRNKIILDLSDGKILSKNYNSKIKRVIIIDDLFLKNDKNIYSENGKGEFGNSLKTSTSSLINDESEKIEKIQIYNSVYNMKEGINIFNLNEQDKSYFNKV